MFCGGRRGRRAAPAAADPRQILRNIGVPVMRVVSQTDVLGTPWLAYVVWILAGARLSAWQSRSIQAPTSVTST